MPSGFTHIIISRKALDELVDAGRDEVAAAIRAHLGLFLLGSVAPDLPYMGFAALDPSAKIADDLHYLRTNQVPLRGLKEAKRLAETDNLDRARALFAFYMGYTSHVIADGISHPFIRDKVGDYRYAASEHRILEMKIDVLLAAEFLSLEINGARIQEFLQTSDPEARQSVFESYASQIDYVYSHETKSEQVENWVNGMQRMLHLAEGNFPYWYREFLGDRGAAFQNHADLVRDKERIFTLELPIDAAAKGFTANFSGRPSIHFLRDVLAKYFEHYPKVLTQLYDSVFNGAAIDENLIPGINLDTGRSLAFDDLNRRPELWK